MQGSLDKVYPIPVNQPDSVVSQAAAVQNTWYTLFTKKRNVKIVSAFVDISVANETLEVTVTVNGNEWTITGFAATAGTQYFISPYMAAGTANVINLHTDVPQKGIYGAWKGDVEIKARKTTATGAGTLRVKVVYDKATR